MKRTRLLWIGIALTLLAFGLRLWGLTNTSLWYDETFMLYHAQRGVVAGVAGLWREDNAIPLHGLLLALWIKVTGNGEFAARYLSVLLGTVTAPLMLRLGGVVTGHRDGGWGAALAYTTLPIYVYYTQEVRMYALAIPLAVAFAWMAWRLVQRERGITAYVVLGVAMMAAHLYAGLLWVTVAVWGTVVIGGKRQEWRLRVSASPRLRESAISRQQLTFIHHSPFAIHHSPFAIRHSPFAIRHSPFTIHHSPFAIHHSPFVSWLKANIMLFLAALPIAAWAVWRARVDATAVSAIPASALRWLPVVFGVGQYVRAPGTLLLVTVALLSTALGLWSLWRSDQRAGGLWIVLTWILPLVLLLSATLVKAKWSERYLLPSFGLALVVGVGTGWERVTSCKLQVASSKLKVQSRKSKIQNLKSKICTLLMGVWLGLSGLALARQAAGTWAVGIDDEWHPRPDFRGVAAYITDHGAAADAVLVVGGYAAHTLDYYYAGPAKVFGLPLDTRWLDTTRALDLRALALLEQQTAGASRLWLVLWQDRLADPTQLVQSVLVDACQRLDVSANFTNVGVLLFDLHDCRPLDRLVTPPTPLDVAFVEPIKLTGYHMIRNDETWEVDVWWASSGPLPADYMVFVHLVDNVGQPVAQHDHIAGADAYPTSQWSSGTQLRDRFFLTVPGDHCPDCILRIGLYTAEGRVPLLGGGDYIEVEVQVGK